MKSYITRSLTALFLFAFFFPAISQDIDTVNSSVNFISWKKTVEKGSKGSFSGMKGDISFDPASPGLATFNVCIDAASINTGSKMRDRHLRAASFLNVENYPEICFNSTSVSVTDTAFIALGEMTIKGSTKEVELPFTYSENTFRGSLDIDRFEYNIGEGNKGTSMVGQYIRVLITCVVK